MAIKKPLVLDANGDIEQLQSGDTITAGILLNDFYGNVAQSSGTTIIPYGNSAPLVTAGTQLWSQVVTPTVIGSIIEIDFSTMIDTSAINLAVSLVIFRNSTPIAFCSASSSAYNGNLPNAVPVKVNDVTTSLTPITYSCRVGISATGTWYVGRGNAGTMGGTNNSGWNIREMSI